MSINVVEMRRLGELLPITSWNNMVFRFARTSIGRALVGWGVTRMSFLIPNKRLRETNTLVAVFHPSPSYPFHVLLIPKYKIKELSELNDRDSDFIIDVFIVAESIVEEYDLKPYGYRMIVNGGKYQDIPQLHFHLVSDQNKKSIGGN